MTLSRLATVSQDAGASFDRKQPQATRIALGSILLEKIFSGADALRDFERRLSPPLLTQWKALRSEADPALFFSDLIRFGLKLEQSERSAEAARLFAATTAFLELAPESLAAFRASAEKNFQALAGRGDFGPRAELLLRRLCKDATDPASLAAMGVAAPLFRAGRLWTAARFQGASLLPEALALGGGFFAETAGFTLTHKAVSSALGRPQDWSPSGLFREWASGALVLGSLKTMGAASRESLRAYMRAERLPLLAQEYGMHGLAVSALPQIGMYGGIVLGHRLEEFFGLREKSGDAALLADSLATLLHLNVGGALVAKTLGAHLQRGQAEADFRLQNWRSRLPYQGGETGIPEAVPAGPRLVATTYRDPIPQVDPLWMKGESESGTVHAPSIWSPEKATRATSFLLDLQLPTKHALSNIFQTAEGQLKMGYTLSQHTFTDKVALNKALCRLGYAIKHARSGKAEGTYVDWLVRTVFQETVERLDGARADRLLRFLDEGGTLADFETMLAEDLPGLRLNRFAAWLPQGFKARNPHYAPIQLTPLPQDLRNILFRWSHTQAHAKERSPHFLPEGELLQALNSNQFVPMGLIRGAIEGAARSPLGILRLKRLTEVLRDPQALHDFVELKLQELADTEYRILGSGKALLSHPLFGSPPSQFNGYLGREAPEAILNEIQRRLPDLLDPKKAELRAQRRKDHLKMLENQHGRLGRMELPLLITAFELLGDPYSKMIAKALKNNEFDLKVLPDAEFEAECRRHSKRVDPERNSAQFFPAGEDRAKGLMLVRERAFDRYSSEVVPDALFTVMGKIAHEFQHYLDMHPRIPDTPRNQLLIEMSAHLRDALWKAEHGDAGKLSSYARDGLSGLALHFRNEFEQVYLDVYHGPSAGKPGE